MLEGIVAAKGSVEEVKRYNIAGVNISMTEAQKNDDRKLYSLKDIFETFAKVSDPVVQPAPTNIVG